MLQATLDSCKPTISNLPLYILQPELSHWSEIYFQQLLQQHLQQQLQQSHLFDL